MSIPHRVTGSVVLVLAAVAFVANVTAQTGTTPYREPAIGQSGIVWRTSADQTHYITVLDPKQLASQPNWDADDEHPPLSPRKAIAAARKVIDELKPYGEDAKLLKPTLKLRTDGAGGDRWFWGVYFSPTDGRQFSSAFPVVVLMNGKALRPQVDEAMTELYRKQRKRK